MGIGLSRGQADGRDRFSNRALGVRRPGVFATAILVSVLRAGVELIVVGRAGV
jgi:hypothetical protein